ncbi:MFS transporter [Raineyella fluvialis]|uniref:MFS transporter n=1 Tax=Raineyella fluvialis TaxID=2662261 RepID=A0A5Q2F8A3_9ACTN|nr:MFS transporter [Raineyella fluvialis]QGF23122.1 MFS transporter [Raineyella fluvialis]
MSIVDETPQPATPGVTDQHAPPATSAPPGHHPAALSVRSGRWIDGYDPEDHVQWEGEGRRIAARNLRWSIACEFLGFIVWQLWSITVVKMPGAGFHLTDSQLFWLISMPSLVGATLRVPYTFMVPRFGGRNWTVVSALLLLIPTIGMGAVLSRPETPFWGLLLVAATAGFGGGNFASSMANISWFFPAERKGWALGLNAAGGNLGAAVAQLVVPLVISIGAAGTLRLPLAGWIWVPLILLAAAAAMRWMDNLSHARGDLAGSLAAIREPHFWLLSLLYIGTFGSFIGFSGVFPKLIADLFPTYSTVAVGTVAVSLSFLGPLVGSLSRPYGGKLADRLGGARITVLAFAAMAGLATALAVTPRSAGFLPFLLLFLALFIAAGIGNGSTYRMIPAVYRARGERRTAGGTVSVERMSSAALGLIAAVGAYGGFLIPQALAASRRATGAYTDAFDGFIAFYLLAVLLTVVVYLRSGAMARAKV